MAAPIAVRPVKKVDDGVIHVVQGAARQTASASPIPARTAGPTTRRPPAAAPPPARDGTWNDPFADGGSRKAVASHRSRNDDDDDIDAPPPRRRSGSAAAAKPARSAARAARASDDDDVWEDPFDAKKAPASRRGAGPATKPAKRESPGRWNDPFTDHAAKPKRSPVAVRDSARSSGRTAAKDEAPSKWNAAAKKHGSDDSTADDDEDSSTTAAQTRGRWGVLKKRH